MILARVLSAVPQAWPVRLEIARAIQTLAKQILEDERRRLEKIASEDCGRDPVAEAYREFYQKHSKAGFREDQPRWPKGSGRRSGRWSGGAGLAAGRIISARLRGGHHYVPKEIFAKLLLKSETRRVFEDAVTGKLAPGAHGWDIEHRAYNKAVESLLNTFMREKDITAEDMTPDDAREFLGMVRRSSNPLIRDFNQRLRP